MASQQIGPQFEHCLGVIRQASVEILTLLKLRITEGKDPRWFLEQLDIARLNLGGWGAVAQRLNINDSQLSDFMLQLRHLQQGIPPYEHGQGATENQLIAAERFVVTLEQLKQQQPLLVFDTAYANDADPLQEQAERQIRAIHLMLHGLVSQVWPDKLALQQALRTHFGAQTVARWQSRSLSHDVLEGMAFSELALLIIDKKAFSRHYASLFNYATTLTFLVEQRLTLHAFLDDIRRMRNTLLAGHPLSEMECLLLDNYTRQITAPIQRAYEQGRTAVNPASLMAADGSEVQHFWRHAAKVVQTYGVDSQPIADNIERLRANRRQHTHSREKILSVALWSGVGIMIVGIVLGGIGMLLSMPESPSLVAPDYVQRSQESNSDTDPALPPREILANRGILWDTNALRSAIDRNDSEVTELFLRAGMSWQLAWTDRALSQQHDEVLNLLLRYRLQMGEAKPCRRFINTLTHELSQGAKLDTMRKSFLQAFCTSPSVVARQKVALDTAQRRNKSVGDAQSRKWVAIQKSVYDVIR